MRRTNVTRTLLVACSMVLAGIMAQPGVNSIVRAEKVTESDVTQRSAAVDLTISSARELNEFAQKVNNGNSYEGMTVKLTNDIVYDGVTVNNYTPIGLEKYFGGTFEGDGHTISGIIVSNQSCAGLFGWVKGKVQNVTVKNCTFEGASRSGGIAGGLETGSNITGEIVNCQVLDCTIKTTSDVGGIAGYTDSDTLILNCLSNSSVVQSSQFDCAGGIAGDCRGKIYNCSNGGSVTNHGNWTTNCTGGICGKLEWGTAVIQNCFNAGKVTGTAERSGGIAGCASGTSIVANSYTSESACATNFGSMSGKESNCKAFPDAYMRGTEFLNLMNANRGANGDWAVWEKRVESPYPVPAKATSLGVCSVSIASGEIAYTGEEQRPAIAASCGGAVLVPDVDYTVTYENNINAGAATAIVRGIGRYMGDVTLPFTIQKAETVISYKAPGSKLYDRYGVTTSLSAKITKGAEKAKLSYRSSDKSVATVSDSGTIKDEGVGATTITISCPESENYKAASVSAVYTIIPGKQTAFVKRSGKKMRVSWFKVSSASGYQVQYAAKKSFKKCKTITIRKKSKTKCTIKKLKRGKTYYVRVRTYKNANVNGQQTVVNGAWSKARKVR